MEAEFYETFFAAVSDWASASEALVEMAFGYATTYGLAALDALHVAAALSLYAEELVTTEQEGPDGALWREPITREDEIPGAITALEALRTERMRLLEQHGVTKWEELPASIRPPLIWVVIM
jgi:hypothetical protein